MTLTITPEQTELLVNRKALRLASLLKVTRTDATVFAFTDHDVDIVFDGVTYSPMAGGEVSARRAETGLRGHDRAFFGILDSAAITAADLHAGLFDDAQVDDYVVDWLHPWVGAFRHDRYWIDNVRFTDNAWTADVRSLTAKLGKRVGRRFQFGCPYDVGDASCTATLLTASGVQVIGVTSNYQFSVSSFTHPVGSPADGEYVDGLITWTSGSNTGVVSRVKTYTHSSLEFELYESTPHNMQAGDQFTLQRGCDRLLVYDMDAQTITDGDCFDVYDNVINFGGWPWLPGTDKMAKTPPV